MTWWNKAQILYSAAPRLAELTSRVEFAEKRTSIGCSIYSRSESWESAASATEGQSFSLSKHKFLFFINLRYPHEVVGGPSGIVTWLADLAYTQIDLLCY